MATFVDTVLSRLVSRLLLVPRPWSNRSKRVTNLLVSPVVSVQRVYAGFLASTFRLVFLARRLIYSSPAMDRVSLRHATMELASSCVPPITFFDLLARYYCCTLSKIGVLSLLVGPRADRYHGSCNFRRGRNRFIYFFRRVL